MASYPTIDANQLRDLNALMTWLRTFPRLEGHGDECQDSAHLLEDMEVATAILFVADEICDESVACSSCKKDTETVWETISSLVGSKMPQVRSKIKKANVTETDVRTFLLSALLCFAVSENCLHRRTYIERIMGLPSHCKQTLMMLIEKGRSDGSQSTPSPRRETPKSTGSKRSLGETGSSQQQHSSERPLKQLSTAEKSVGDRSWTGDESFGSPVFPGYTPQRKSGKLSVNSLFSPATIDSSLEKLVANLRKQNESLKEELAGCQRREVDLGQKMQNAEVAFRKEMMKLEWASMQREEDARESHQQELARLQQELDDLREARETGERAQRELASVQDDMDLLEHTKEKLAETEEKLRIARERIEQFGDVKEALTREEEAHGASVEECIRLDNELKALQPLRRQLEDYKTRAVEAEVKLAECKEDLKRLSQITGSLNSAQKEILKGARIHKEEAEELRRRLLDEEAGNDGPGVGEGLSELNPVVMEEMARLRNENMQLKAFAAKREDDSVQMLEERLDDTNRLADRFKEQFLTTKSQLEDTEQQLQLSQEHVANLQTQVEEISIRIEYLGQELDDYKAKLSMSRDELAETSHQLQESTEREEGLRGNVAQLTQKASDAEGLAAHRLELLDSTNAELQDTVSELHATQEREQSLFKEVAEWTEKTTAAEAALLELESQLSGTKRNLDDATTSLDAALEREVELNDWVEELEKVKQALEDKIQSEIQVTQKALLAKDKELEETRQNLEEEARRGLNEMNEYMTMSLDKQRAAHEQQLAAASDAYAQLEQKTKVDYSQLQEKFEHDLHFMRNEFQEKVTKLEDSHASDIATVKQSAVEERNEIIAKGKAILKETKQRAEEELASTENQLQKVEAELVELRRNHEAFEQRSKSRIASYKQKINFASGRITELSQSNDNKDETIEELEREKFKLREENERFRRQLGGRFGADGKVQNQLETLQKEFNAILDENRSLKKEIEKNANPRRNGLSAISESSEVESGQRSYTQGGVSGSTLSQLRKEYEETIDALTDEKRSLVMRNSAAITDVQKAEQRAWESDKQVAKLKEELTSVKLALQRLERDSGEDQKGTSEDDTKENERSVFGSEDFKFLTQPSSSSLVDGPSLPAEEFLFALGSSTVQAIPLSESTEGNRTDHATSSSQSSTATAVKPAVDAFEFPSDHSLRRRVSSGRSKKNDMQGVSTLMEYAMHSQNTPTDDAQPECQQS